MKLSFLMAVMTQTLPVGCLITTTDAMVSLALLTVINTVTTADLLSGCHLEPTQAL